MTHMKKGGPKESGQCCQRAEISAKQGGQNRIEEILPIERLKTDPIFFLPTVVLQ
jgi:hypothetical protein